MSLARWTATLPQKCTDAKIFSDQKAVLRDIEFAVDERSADVRVVTDAVAMDDGIYQRKRDRQDSFAATERSTGAGPRESEGSEDVRT